MSSMYSVRERKTNQQATWDNDEDFEHWKVKQSNQIEIPASFVLFSLAGSYSLQFLQGKERKIIFYTQFTCRVYKQKIDNSNTSTSKNFCIYIYNGKNIVQKPLQMVTNYSC